MAENQEIEDAVIRKVDEVKKDEGPGKDKDVELPKIDPKLEELISFLKNGSGYLVTVTTVNNGRLNHHLLSNNFAEIDVLKSLAATEKLAVERLKNL